MNARLVFAAAASLCIAAAAGWYVSQTVAAPPSHAASAPQAAAAPSVQTVGGETVVVVAVDAQRASGIVVAPVVATSVRAHYDAYATVVDPQPLVDLRTKLAGARADVATLTGQAQASSAEYQRSRTLFDDDHNVSLKALQNAQALMQADRDKRQTAKAALAGLIATAKLQYGEVLSRAAVDPDSKLLMQLQSGEASILRVTLPSSISASPADRLTLDAPDGRPVVLQKLSVSLQADPAVQGTPWFYAAQRALPVGTHTTVTAPAAQTSTPALLLPSDAIVWYGGQTWASVRVAPDRFARRYVKPASENEVGIAVTSGFHSGDQVVTRGAQLLLSQELKPQGVATACKDPPECDD